MSQTKTLRQMMAQGLFFLMPLERLLPSYRQAAGTGVWTLIAGVAVGASAI